MTSQGTDKDQLRQLCDVFWQFHNDRLNDPSLTDMTPYLQPFLDLIARERRKAAIEELKSLQNTPLGGKVADWKNTDRTSDEAFQAVQNSINERLATLSQEDNG